LERIARSAFYDADAEQPDKRLQLVADHEARRAQLRERGEPVVEMRPGIVAECNVHIAAYNAYERELIEALNSGRGTGSVDVFRSYYTPAQADRHLCMAEGFAAAVPSPIFAEALGLGADTKMGVDARKEER